MKKNLLLLGAMILLTCRIASAQCQAYFSYNVTSYNPPVVEFYDSSLIVQQPATYIWDFNDGGPTGTTANPIHTFPANGSYNVCMTMSDNSGCTDTICFTLTLNPPQPTVSAFMVTDSMSMFACAPPAFVNFYYSASTSGYASTDSIQFDMNFGDGVDSVFKLIQAAHYNGTLTHQFLNAGSYTPQLIVTGPDGTADTMASYPATVASSCGTISGTVYQDNNNNCINDAGDVVLANQGVSLLVSGNFTLWANTDANGFYSFNVPTGAGYEIQAQSGYGYNNHYTVTCPVSGTYTNVSAPSTSNDFGLSCPQGFDLQGSLYTWGFRPGFNGEICVNVYNQRCVSPSTGTITVTLDPLVTPLPDTAGVYTVSGQTVTYPITGPSLNWSFCISILTSPNAVIGDTICTLVDIQPVTGDSVPSNNSFTKCYPVVSSWDPNDKAVSPAGNGPTGAILSGEALTYTIRFQNTGNLAADNVYILDTLSPNLDPLSLEVIAASHTMTYSILAGNIIRFDFANINLPDMNSHEPQSHGYVSYRISQQNNLPQLAEITNTAAIYFDFNQPVITNTTLNTIDNTLSVGDPIGHSSLVNVYPNPANNKCYLFFKDNHARTISVTDVLGKEVTRISSSADSFILNTEKFAEGLYSVRVTDGNNTDTYKLIISH